jgi:flagellar protein FlgJ
MTTGMNLSALAGSLDSATNQPQSPKKLQEAAKQFEALMIGQMMKTVRDSGEGSWLSEGDEAGEDSSMSMAEEQFAQAMASNGGLGLAKMVMRTMSHAGAVPAAEPGTAPSPSQTASVPVQSK